MCILCVVQKWSRRIATMLPWLVIPLIGLWALSQLLPPGFRFEVTSPRLACVLVLLVTLFWYEVLMPQLSAWRARRSARLRERKRSEAIELQKLRKTATRRCRNCLTAYRDQNPGGGRFMCSYCGHISKRPVLDLPGHNSAMLGVGNSGFIGDLVGKGGKILNSKVWSENGWMCNGQEWPENGSYWGWNRPAFFGGEDSCLPEKSYSGVVSCKMLVTFVCSIRWLLRKIFRVGSGREDASLDNDHKIGKKGENGGDYHESKGEKAKRKAEEKRQARLERELLEEEERKQREEVARLVEEQRRLRDEKQEAEKEHCKALSGPDGERDNRREAEKRKQEKRRDKDKGSSKSNSDGEELERKACKEGERKRDSNKRNDIERRDHHKTIAEGGKPHASELRHDGKGVSNSFGRVYGGGSRYFDRVKGSFLSSSKAFNGANFFGRNSHTAASSSTKVNKFSGHGDHLQTPAARKEVHHAETMVGKPSSSWEGKNSGSMFIQSGGVDVQHQPNVQKKTWQQLFTRSSPSTSTLYQGNQNEHLEVKKPMCAGQTSPNVHLDNQLHYGLPSSFAMSPLANGSMGVSSLLPAEAGPAFPPVGGQPHDFTLEEPELYEDPCYIPDPASLLGPLSESLDDFPLDLGSAFVPNAGLEKSHVLKNMSVAAEVNKPSPIESPMSRLRVAEDRHINSVLHPSTPKSQDPHSSSPDESANTYAQGTWQMWGTAPLGQDSLGIMGGPANWLLSIGNNKPDMKDVVHPAASHKPMAPHYSVENQILSGSPSPQKVRIGNGNNNGTLRPLGLASNVNDPWLQEGAFQRLPGDTDSLFPPLSLTEGVSRAEVPFNNSNNPASGYPYEVSPVNCWSKRDWAVNGAVGGIGNSAEARPHVGGLFSGPDVQSLWSFN